MVARGYTRRCQPLRLLAAEQVEAIHRGTLHVLETAGARFDSKRALDLFRDAGCEVIEDEGRVRFPPGLVEACLEKCPSSFVVNGRDPRQDVRFGGNTVYFYNSVGMRTVDLETWEPRTPTLEEQNDGVRILDALENVHFVNSYTPYMEIEGVPHCMMLLQSLASRLRHTLKPTLLGYLRDSEVFAIEMAKAAGIRPLGMVAASPPLTFYPDACQAAFRFVEAGFPIWVSGGAVAGGTAPATVAGSTVSNNAELMAGIVLVQLIRPGTPVMVSDFVFPMNMRNGNPSFGALGCALHGAVFCQMWREYGVPAVESLSGYPSSKKMDIQSGYEKASIALPSALAGASLVSMHGGVHGELTYHPIQSVVDDDLAGLIGRLVESVEVSPDTLALDLITEVGPIPGTFIDRPHTRQWWRKEQFVPKVADRLTYPEWIEQGKKSALELARERVDEILSGHHVPPLSEDQDEEIEHILQTAREHYRDRGDM